MNTVIPHTRAQIEQAMQLAEGRMRKKVRRV